MTLSPEIARLATQITPPKINGGILSDMFVPGTSEPPLLVWAKENNATAARAFDAANSINMAIAAATVNVAFGATE
jgi:hypothetical protein